MSDNVVHSDSDGDDSVRPYQSVWMSHWKHTSCKSADQPCTHVITNYDLEKERHDYKSCPSVDNPKLGIKVSEYVRGSKQVGETRAMSRLKEIKNESMDYRPLPGSAFFMNKFQIGSSSVGGVAVVDGGISPSWLPLVTESGSSLMEFTSELKALRKYPLKQVRSIDFVDNSLIVSKFFQDEFKGSASKSLPFQFLSKGLSLHSTGDEKNSQPIAFLSSEEHLSKTNRRRFLSAVQDQKPDLECNDVENHSNCGLFKSRSLSHLKGARLNELPNECYSLPSLPLSMHDVKTMRISTNINSLEESSRGSPKISKTTHHFLVSKKTHVNLSEEAQMVRESTITAEFKEKHLSDLFHESTDFSIHNQKKANTPQSWGSSPDIKDIGTSAVCPTNDSSADTDTMDLDPFHENNLAGLPSHGLNKDLEFELDRKARSHNASNLAGESSGPPHTELPDINKELTDFPTQENGANMKETSTSTTRSLDVFRSSKSTSSANDSFKQNLNNKWVKRLKCNGSSDRATGHGNSQTEGASLGKKVVQINKIINLSPSKPSTGERYAKKQKIYDGRKNLESLLSHPWIQRWSTTTSDKKLGPMGVCEPLNEYEGKQFPSIAAMALMGKAMNGFQACEFRKEGSYSVWNTKDL